MKAPYMSRKDPCCVLAVSVVGWWVATNQEGYDTSAGCMQEPDGMCLLLKTSHAVPLDHGGVGFRLFWKLLLLGSGRCHGSSPGRVVGGKG